MLDKGNKYINSVVVLNFFFRQAKSCAYHPFISFSQKCHTCKNVKRKLLEKPLEKLFLSCGDIYRYKIETTGFVLKTRVNRKNYLMFYVVKIPCLKTMFLFFPRVCFRFICLVNKWQSSLWKRRQKIFKIAWRYLQQSNGQGLLVFL